MKWPTLMFVPLLLLISAPLQAADVCPWFTQGSAARILGGEVVATIAANSTKEGSCKYSRDQAGKKDSMEIYVASRMPSPCPTGSESASGIGNEALACSVKSPPRGRLYQVDSRVRDVRFTVFVRVHDSESQKMYQQEVREAAEQVAGNLF